MGTRLRFRCYNACKLSYLENKTGNINSSMKARVIGVPIYFFTNNEGFFFFYKQLT